MVRGVLEAHGYEEPIFIGEGSFAKVYRVRDKEGCFWACGIFRTMGAGMQKLAGDQASAFSGVQRALDTRRDGISDH